MLSKEEIEEAKEISEDLIELLKKNTLNINKILNLIKEGEAIETLLQYIEQLEQENNKLNKMIDETIKYIATLDIEEDICSKIENEYCDKMSLGECECCIKQYFEKKVEGN